MEKYKDECEEFHKKLQAEVMRREEVSFVVAQPCLRRLQVSATQYLRKSATVICQGCVAHSVHGESSLSPISAADESRNRKVMNREEFGETAHNYSDTRWWSIRRQVFVAPWYLCRRLPHRTSKVENDRFDVENFAPKNLHFETTLPHNKWLNPRERPPCTMDPSS